MKSPNGWQTVYYKNYSIKITVNIIGDFNACDTKKQTRVGLFFKSI